MSTLQVRRDGVSYPVVDQTAESVCVEAEFEFAQPPYKRLLRLWWDRSTLDPPATDSGTESAQAPPFTPALSVPAQLWQHWHERHGLWYDHCSQVGRLDGLSPRVISAAGASVCARGPTR